MCASKIKILADDLKRTKLHLGITEGTAPFEHPIKTLRPMRLLAAAAELNEEVCVPLSHKLFDDYWVHNKDVRENSVLQESASTVGWHVNIDDMISGVGREKLLQNTEEALNRGSFGVPSFWVNNRLFYGVDHLHFVERALGNASAALPRFYPVPGEPRKAKLTIYHDFASPWSYIGSTQIPKLLSEIQPVSVEVEWVPIVVGALFKMIGTPVVPMNAVSDSKRKYGYQDLLDYAEHHGVGFQFTSHFPLHSLLSLRVMIVNSDDRLRKIIYEAAWKHDKDIGDPQVLSSVLSDAGFDSKTLIAATQDQQVKDRLRKNTERAFEAGLCGVPSYQVNDGSVIWGQDRLNIVADLLCGWEDHLKPIGSNSKL
ncbi:2-hydroxychromene-2-carboxylate isomerase-like isoform X2 [Porites lutea]